MKTVLLLPVFRFGKKLNSISIRTIEIYSRINKKNFNFIINLDLNTYKDIDKYYYDKIKYMDKSFAYAGKNIAKLLIGIVNTLKNARRSDFIICESEYFYSVIYSYLIHLISRKPLIIIINLIEPDMLKSNNKIHSIIYKYIFYRIRLLFILDNDPIVNEFKHIFNDNKIKLFKVTNGIDINSFYTSIKKSYDLLYIGEIGERKNSFIIPDIIEELKNFNGNIKMLIISHFGEIEKLKSIIRKKKLDKNIEFKTYVTEAEKRKYLAESKIMIFPTKYEGFGIVIAEALASQLPVVLFDVPSLKIFNKGTLKVKPFELNDYIKSIIYLLNNENARLRIGEEGRNDAIQRFDYDYVSNIENNEILSAVHYLKY